MPSTPLTDAIIALTTYANTVTGESDATLSAAVGTLADGYGGVELPSVMTKEADVTITAPSNSSTGYLDSSWPFLTAELATYIGVSETTKARFILNHRSTDKNDNWDYWLKNNTGGAYNTAGSNYALSALDTKGMVFEAWGASHVFSVFKIVN